MMDRKENEKKGGMGGKKGSARFDGLRTSELGGACGARPVRARAAARRALGYRLDNSFIEN